MYRIAFCMGLALSVAACAGSAVPLSSGFADGPPPSRTYKKPDVALGADTSVPRGPNLGMTDTQPSAATSKTGVKIASLDADKAPKGTFEKAPAGSLSDRDYSKTALDPAFARDVINQYRAENGLKPLKLSAELTAAAKTHSRDLAKWDRISHYGSDGSNPWDRVKRAGFKARVAAENVGTGQIDFSEVMKGWKESPGHNKNLLLSDADYMGIALVQEPKSEFKSFWTLVLGSPM
ncbi:MAG: CAP domain-containing protein [Hyphomicrobiaceae bacterium]|nr:CAP domain-containing protein [Hyphomicrobiaceae bacterium]